MLKKQDSRDKTINTRQHKQERRKEEVQESDERVFVTLVSVLWQVCLLSIQLTPEQRNIIKNTPRVQQSSGSVTFWYFFTAPDADPRIRTSEKRIRMRIRAKIFSDF
jgi:hypothetical protein